MIRKHGEHLISQPASTPTVEAPSVVSATAPIAVSHTFVPVFVTCPPLCALEMPHSPPVHRLHVGEPRPLATPVRLAFAGAGLFAVGMAYLGVLIPGLPATPWVLLASYCFSKSSPRLARWLLRSPIFGRMLRDWNQHRGIRKPVKIFAVISVLVVVSLTMTFGPLPLWAKCATATFSAVGVCTILFAVPTVKDEPVVKDRLVVIDEPVVM